MKEQQIEQTLINKLSDLKYVHRSDIKDRKLLEQNFREKFDTLNMVKLSDVEFERLKEKIITPDVYIASQTLRQTNTFSRDDGTPLHYVLVNIKDWCKNTFEVINQLRITTSNSHHIYDVVLLINGVPVAQIELKTLQINPHRAMQQIVGYKNDPGNGYGKTLMCFLQLFIVSNLNDTWYFANNNSNHFSFDTDDCFLPLYQFANENNEKITHLESFAEKFLAKCTFGQMISRYMVLLASEQKLLMMRPYQIYAVKAIVDCIHQNSSNGYVWHTTGSGKTLTSFKASTLLKDNVDIEKCLFVVDRKDLDRQTREEFNKFQEGCVEENTNTNTLVERLLSHDYADKVIVTTIQKLGLALDSSSKYDYKKRLEPLQDKRIVFIFDECHRSQFGDNHKAIKKFFPKAQLFGFTGTPIFDQNATYQGADDKTGFYKTTETIFQHQLHSYTITDAIEDRNVLRFRIDYFKQEGTNNPRQGESLAKSAVIDAILKTHDAATADRKFNAILATAKINDAIEYFELFKTIQAEKQASDLEFKPLNVACVFSPPAEGNKDVQQIQEDLQQERIDNSVEQDKKKRALKAIIGDYNKQYCTNHTVGEFDKYYQDVQKRIKDQQYPNRDLPHSEKIDITIVVDMLLTGFDSKFLNTLYVDKNLKHHGLIQAFSRTNRVLNDNKPFGNIFEFRQQQDAVDEAITLFSGEGHAEMAKSIWLVDSAPKLVERLDCAVKNMDNFMQSQGLENKPEDVPNLKGDAARVGFVNLFKDVQRLKTQLDQYTNLDDAQKEQIEILIPNDQLRGFKGVYLSLASRLKEEQTKEGDMAEPEVQDIDFEFVLFASEVIDYDYIMKLLAKLSNEAPSKQIVSRSQLIGLIESDAKFLDERDDIKAYINILEEQQGMSETQIREGYENFKSENHTKELTSIAKKHDLEVGAMDGFVEGILQRMIFDDEDLSILLAPLGLGWKARTEKKLAVMEDLIPLLRKRTHGREISGLSAYE